MWQESNKKSASNENQNQVSNQNKQNNHSKFTPGSQVVKSRKPIEDDFEITM